jgi:hypothetical protein
MYQERIAVARHRSDLGAWEMATRQAHPALRDHVTGYCGYWELTPGGLRRRQVASTTVPLIISFGERIDVSWPGHAAARHGVTTFIAGVHDRPVVTEHAGSQHGIEAMLTPLGAYTLLGVPMRELANTVVGVEDLLGGGAAKLTARPAETPTWGERLAMLDEALAVRLAAGREPSAEAGWSRRHLVARFREQVGLPPKTIAKLLRFERGLRLLQTGASPRRPGAGDHRLLPRLHRARPRGQLLELRHLPAGAGLAGRLSRRTRGGPGRRP